MYIYIHVYIVQKYIHMYTWLYMYVKCVYVERLVGKYTMTHHEKNRACSSRYVWKPDTLVNPKMVGSHRCSSFPTMVIHRYWSIPISPFTYLQSHQWHNNLHHRSHESCPHPGSRSLRSLVFWEHGYNGKWLVVMILLLGFLTYIY